jgi:methyltransferase-like protein
VASMEELKRQLNEAAAVIDVVSMTFGPLVNDLINAQGLVNQSFEGSGNADHLVLSGRVQALYQKLDESLQEALMLSEDIREASGRL